MEETVVEIVNRAGMHARPASEFVKLAGSFNSTVRVEKDGLEVDGKSIMGVLMLAAEFGASVTIRATGDDAPQALDALVQLIQRGFEEG